jgi:low affinity Fe/Cu permease
MDIQAVSGAATVAIICAIVFLIAAKSWHLLTSTLTGQPNFADSIMSEAAQRFRDELKQLAHTQSAYLGAALVFVVMYIATSAFHGPELFIGYPEWQLYVLLSALAAAALFALYRLIRTVFAWRTVRFMRDANIAIGHQLQRIASAHGRAYHDVPTTAGIVDHVLIGQSGVYAINVVARRHLKQGSVALGSNDLHFSNTEKTLPIVDVIATTHRLEKEFRKILGKNIRVRSVIAVPGWEISKQSGNDHLLVNERNLPMISGWKDQRDYLMNEDVDALQNDLMGRCKLIVN